ncbi:polysaccharide biosynthesis protein [Tessaracoccus antarcticus]|nr:nucleoside-diphosphate sugar epimerase/dehydratase [Tessaracoccus antarcticus]
MLLERTDVHLTLSFIDALCWFVAAFALIAFRYDFELNAVQWSSVLVYSIFAASAQMLLGWLAGVYRGSNRIGSFIEASTMATVTLAVGFIVGLVFMIGVPDYPNGVAFLAPFLALILMGAARFVARAVAIQIFQRYKAAGKAERILLYGAGNAGRMVGNLFFSDPDSKFQVVGLIDDDPRKRHRRFEFGRVVGQRKDMIAKARALGVQSVLVAIPTASADFLKQLSSDLDAAGMKMLVLPPLREWSGGQLKLGDIHEFDVTDLLGRDPIKTDLTSIADYVRGKVVLITGAGGSIGSEIARQVHQFGPKELVCLDRDESALHSVQLSIYGQGLLDTPDMVLCDIRDKPALQKIFEAHRPHVVFHAAALKHLPLLEQYPDEGWKTNVLGTLDVLECAAEFGVETFVNISTDKAADPTSVLGKTKRRAEELTAWFAENHDGNYLSVRFGNVLGSRGSVLHTFAQQIERGGPITVVHPDVTRFFMTIPEACQLVIQAGAVGQGGQVLVLNMGEPVRILDMAKRLIRDSGKDIGVRITGLREGEKLHEVLFSGAEQSSPSIHPLISAVRVAPRSPVQLVAPWVDNEDRPEPHSVTKRPVQNDQTGWSPAHEKELNGASVGAAIPDGSK